MTNKSIDPLNMTQGLNYTLKPLVPTINYIPTQKVITVNINGDPNEQTSIVCGPLYATAYAIRSIYKAEGRVFKVEKLRGRWPLLNMSLPKSQWTGTYALPVPNDVVSLPQLKASKKVDGVEIKLETWNYGLTGQIMHMGSYESEQPTISKLHEYLKNEGHAVKYDTHEEVYVSDPRKSVENKLKTLILYRLK